MKRILAILAVAMSTAITAQAADQVVDVEIRIPDANVTEMVAMLDSTYGSDVIYEAQTNVVEGVTNVVSVVKAESPKQKFRRISRRSIERFWRGKLNQYNRKKSAVTTSPVTTE